MIFLDNNSENLVHLIRLLQSIPNVAQIRVNTVIRPSRIEKYGKNAVSIRCLIPHINDNDLFAFAAMRITEAEYEDLSLHPLIMAKMKTLVDEYVYQGIVPPKVED